MSDSKTIRCGQCNKLLKVPVKPQAVRVKCPQCQTVLQVPGTSPAPAPAPARATKPQGSFDFGDLPSAQASNQNLPFNQGPLGSAPATPSATTRYAPQRNGGTNRAGGQSQPKRPGGVPTFVYVLLGIFIVLPLFCCGGLGVLGLILPRPNANRIPRTTPAVSNGPATPLQTMVPASTVSGLPSLDAIEKTFPSGVKSYFVKLTGDPNVVASQMAMRVYIPPGEHSAGSLPCVLVAPAGTSLLHGVTFGPNEDYHDETLPYAEAGMVVIQYSLDGPLPESAESSEQAMVTAIAEAYPRFRDAGAGVANGRTAVEFATNKLTMVDPSRIYCAGHSSAANVALLLAANEPRINRCIAYAAAYDFESRMSDAISDPSFSSLLPGGPNFIRQSSPMNVVEKIRCPVMVFHARDDDNVPFSDAEKFVDALKRSGKEVNFVTANNGGHYSPMLSIGIPTAIQWLKN